MHTPPSSRGCCFLPRAPCSHGRAEAKAKHLKEVCALNPQKGGEGSCASSIPRHSALLHTPVFTGVLLLSPRAVLAQAREGKGKAPRRGVCIESPKRRKRKLRQAAFHDIPLHRRKTPAGAGVFVCGITARFFSLRCAAHVPRDRALRRGRSRVCRKMRTRVPARKF